MFSLHKLFSFWKVVFIYFHVNCILKFLYLSESEWQINTLVIFLEAKHLMMYAYGQGNLEIRSQHFLLFIVFTGSCYVAQACLNLPSAGNDYRQV